MDSEVVGLGRYASAIRRRRWIVLLTTFVFAAGVAGYVTVRSPTYSATAQVLLTPYSKAKFSEAVFTTGQVDTQVLVVQSLTVAETVVSDLKLSESPTTLQKHVTAAPVGDTSVIAVTVTAGTPAQSALIANHVASAYVLYRSAHLPKGATGTFATVVSNAQPPRHRSGPSPLVGGLFGLVVGLVLGCIAALIADRRDKSLLDEPAVADAVDGLPMLGRIPRMKTRSRGPTLVQSRESSDALAFRFLATTVRLLDKDRRERSETVAPTVLMIVSAGPRDGRTSVAANVALAAAESGQRVLVCDADLTQPGLTRLFGVDNEVTIERLLRHTVPLDLDQLSRPAPNVYALGSHGVLTSQSALLGDGSFRSLIGRFPNHVDLVVVDTSPLLSSADVLELVPQADVLLFVVRERVSMEADVKAALEQIKQTGATVSGVVLTGSSSFLGTQRSTRRRASSAILTRSPVSEPPPAAASSTPPTQASKR